MIIMMLLTLNGPFRNEKVDFFNIK